MLSVFLSLSSLQVYAETDLSAREIMEKVDEESRKSSDSAFTRMKLTTCRYGLSGGKIKCAEKARVKLVERVHKLIPVKITKTPRVLPSSLSLQVRKVLVCCLTVMTIVIETMKLGCISLLLEK